MIKVRIYEKGDWNKVKGSVEPFMPIYTSSEFDVIASRGVAVTATEEGEAIACGGVTFMGASGFVWLKMNNSKVRKPIETALLMRDIFKLMVESVGDVEVSTYILDGFRKGERLARFIGMEKNCEFVTFRNRIYNKYTVVV